MELLYDATPLAYGAEPGPGRTGIFRLGQGYVNELLKRTDQDLEISFASLDTWFGEVQLFRYDRSHGGVLAQSILSGWSYDSAKLAHAMSLVEVAVASGEDSPDGSRAIMEVGFLNRLAQPQPVAGSFDVYHSLRPALVGRDRVRAERRFVTVHDLIPIRFPEWCDDGQTDELISILGTIQPDDTVIVSTSCTRDDLRSYLDFEPARVAVVPLASDPAIFFRVSDHALIEATRRRLGIPSGPYVLSVATLEPRKNLAALVKAFTLAAGDPQLSDFHLVLVGAEGWKNEALSQLLASSRAKAAPITLTGFVPDEDLAALYSGAEAFVYPSFYEGFGLPVLEAMSCGIPVVTSDTPALQEVGGGAALTVSPDDIDAMAGAILSAIGDSDLSQRCLDRSAAFSWSRTVDLTLEAYQAVAG